MYNKYISILSYSTFFLSALLFTSLHPIKYSLIKTSYAADKNASCDGSCGGACAGNCSKEHKKKEKKQKYTPFKNTDEEYSQDEEYTSSSSEANYNKYKSRKKKKKKRREYRILRQKERTDPVKKTALRQKEKIARKDKKYTKKKEEHKERKNQRQQTGQKTPSDSEDTDELHRRHEQDLRRLLRRYRIKYSYAEKKQRGELSSATPTPSFSSDEKSSSIGSEEEQCKHRHHCERKEWANEHRVRTEKIFENEEDEDFIQQRLRELSMNKNLDLEAMEERHANEREEAKEKDRRKKKNRYKKCASTSSSDGESEDERCKKKQEEELKDWSEQGKKKNSW